MQKVFLLPILLSGHLSIAAAEQPNFVDVQDAQACARIVGADLWAEINGWEDQDRGASAATQLPQECSYHAPNSPAPHSGTRSFKYNVRAQEFYPPGQNRAHVLGWGELVDGQQAEEKEGAEFDGAQGADRGEYCAGVCPPEMERKKDGFLFASSSQYGSVVKPVALAVSSDGRYVAAETESGRRDERVVIRIFDMETGVMIKAAEKGVTPTSGIVFSPVENLLACVLGRMKGQPRTTCSRIAVWDVEREPRPRVIVKDIGVRMSGRVAFSSDGQCVIGDGVGVDHEEICKMWDAKTGREIKKLSVTDNPLVKEIHLYNQLQRHGNGRLFLARDGVVAAIVDHFSCVVDLLNLETKEKRVISYARGPGFFGVHVLSAAFFPDGRYLAVGTKETRTSLYSGRKEAYGFIEIVDLSEPELKLQGARNYLAGAV